MPLTDEQLDHFHREGYLVAREIIPDRCIYDLRDEIDRVVDNQARQLAAAGKVTELHEDLDVLHRVTAIFAECPEIINPLRGGTQSGPAVFRLITCPEILDVMAQLVGPEVFASAVYRLRPKLPFRPEGVVPWHQDSGYFDSSGDDHLIVTCWVPLMNATVEAGCMEVVPRSHRQGVLPHYIAEVAAPPLCVHPDHLPETTPVPVPADIGDIVLLTNLTCHRSTANTSGLIRWAADLRYNGPEAGDYYPSEAGFLARSQAHPERVLTSAEAFNDLRRNHRSERHADRWGIWPKQAETTFIKPPFA